MENDFQWFVGVDWASAKHDVCILNRSGAIVERRAFEHSGAGLNAMAEWILKTTDVSAAEIAVAIETPHGPIVEALMERGLALFSINPKQLDRFRDRFSPAGAKDDDRDALVLASSLRTDAKAFRPLAPVDPLIVELREWSRIAEDLTAERTRLANRLREQFWRFYPQMINLNDDLAADWVLELWQLMPTPEKAQHTGRRRIETVLKHHRIRRIDAEGVLAILQTPALSVAPGTAEAASAHIRILIERLVPLNRQIAKAAARLDKLIADLAGEGDDAAGQTVEQRDVTILQSLPGVGRIVLATLLAEANELLQRRDYHALRCLSGVAPVTRKSGKSKVVSRRLAAHPRLANALYHWSRVAVQHDPRSRAKYAALRQRGHNHARSLRAVGDRLLNVACKMLETRTAFDHAHNHK